MKTLEQEWQYQWHLHLGLDTENMESDIGCDFGMHFDIWQAEPEIQEKCFALFDGGDCMLRRARRARSIVGDSSGYSDTQLVEFASEHAAAVRQFMETEPLIREKDCEKFDEALDGGFEVVRGNPTEVNSILKSCDVTTYYVDYVLPELIERECGDVAERQYHFLGEPLYRVQDSYLIRNWIFWCLIEEKISANPYRDALDSLKTGAWFGYSASPGRFVIGVYE